MADTDTDDEDSRKSTGWKEFTGGAIAGAAGGTTVAQLIGKSAKKGIETAIEDKYKKTESIKKLLSEIDDHESTSIKKAEFDNLTKSLKETGTQIAGLGEKAQQISLELEKKIKNPLVIFKNGPFLTKVALVAAVAVPAIAVGHAISLYRNRGIPEKQPESFAAREQEKGTSGGIGPSPD